MQNPLNDPSRGRGRGGLLTPLAILSALLLMLCMSCVFVLVAGGIGLYQYGTQAATQAAVQPPLPLLPAGKELLGVPTDTAVPTPLVARPPVASLQTGTIETLTHTVLPARHLEDLACRLQGQCNQPRTQPSGPFAVGARRTFNAYNVDENRNFKVDATLQYLTDHAYFWVEDGASVNSSDLQKLADTFESKIYPTDREFFGSEWTPGVDGDPHIYILFARDLGPSIAGFFSSADEYPSAVHQFSNAHEMFFFNVDNPRLRRSFTYGVLAHEFQHMIQWNQDLNEETWLNEGFSELAAFLNGYDLGGYDYSFITDTDLQLNDWPHGYNDDTIPHYGASFLFLDYFLDRFGRDAAMSLARDPANGLGSFDDILSQINATDPLTGQAITTQDFFLDWAVTNYVHDASVGDGRYAYHNYSAAPQAFETETVSTCPSGSPQPRRVHQYGTDYIRFTCPGQYTLHFSGSTELPLLSADPYSGDYAFWGNRGDESDPTLQREFDFTGVTGPIDMTYHVWYDIEDGFDYAYLEASTDGQHWQILRTPSGTITNPNGNSYGYGYTGQSNGWLQEQVDLSRFAGQKVQLRFEYITDDGATGDGFLVDDISVPAVHYFTNFESGDGGWQADGFARIQNRLPQTFRLALVTKGAQTAVQIIPVGPDQSADIPIDIGANGVDEATLVVVGTTRYTTQPATYSFEVK